MLVLSLYSVVGLSQNVEAGREQPVGLGIWQWFFPEPKEFLFSPLSAYQDPASEKAYAKYILPNEFHNSFQFDQMSASLSAKSVVISVGTIRSFNTAGVLRRDALIALDYAPAVVEFNRLLARMISDLDYRTFVSELLGRQVLFGETLQSEEFLRVAREAKADPSRVFFQTALGRQMHQQILASQGREAFGNHWEIWLDAMKSFAKSESTWKTAFFSDEAAFLHLKHLIKEGRFVSVQGSLSGENALQKIAKELKSMGAWVSELDLSNALEHVVAYERLDGTKKFLENLQSLPTKADTHVLMTLDKVVLTDANVTGDHAQSSKWVYLISSPSELASALEKVGGINALDSHLLGLREIPGNSCRRSFL